MRIWARRAAFACLLGGMTLACPALAAAADGIYTAAVGEDNTMFLVDTASIGPAPGGRLQANVYQLDHLGLDDGRYTDSFDCAKHREQTLSGVEFVVADDDSDVRSGTATNLDADDDDKDGSVMRVLEDFVCGWPASVAGRTPIPNVPADEHVRMLLLGVAAKQTLGK
jgi:hypothetical protein